MATEHRPRKYRGPLDPVRGKTVRGRIETVFRVRLVSTIGACCVTAVVIGVWGIIGMTGIRDRVFSVLAGIVGVVGLLLVTRYYRLPVDPARVRPIETFWNKLASKIRQRVDGTARQVHRGRVKFFKSDKGWGGIESDETPGDVWVHFSTIVGSGYRELVQGEEVEFRYEPTVQDSWRYRATWVRPLKPRDAEPDRT